MPILKITQPTFLKQSVDQSSSPHFIAPIPVSPGVEYEISTYVEKDKHYKFTLKTGAIAGLNSWFVFKEHCEISEAAPKAIRLNVEYYSQRDNAREAWRTCSTSTHAMLLNFLKPGSIKGDNDYYNRYVAGQDSTDWAVHTRALKANGVESYFSTTLDYADLDSQLAKGIPVAIGVLHRGTLQNPTGGHVILVIGNGYVCNDPNGCGFGDSAYTNPNGAGVYYPKQSLNSRWIPGQGFGRIVTAIDGKKI